MILFLVTMSPRTFFIIPITLVPYTYILQTIKTFGKKKTVGLGSTFFWFPIANKIAQINLVSVIKNQLATNKIISFLSRLFY